MNVHHSRYVSRVNAQVVLRAVCKSYDADWLRHLSCRVNTIIPDSVSRFNYMSVSDRNMVEY
jgi:hypothetical protein